MPGASPIPPGALKPLGAIPVSDGQRFCNAHGSRGFVRSTAADIANAMGRWYGIEVDARIVPKPLPVDLVRLTWPQGGSCDYQPVGPLWSVSEWEPIAKAMIGSRQVTLAPPRDVGLTLQALLTPLPETVLRIDGEVGARLAAFPCDPGVHEEAALVAAVFAFRETAEQMSDIRDGLARLCAHLSLAKALGGGQGDGARVAAAILETLLGRELPAIALVDAWPRDNPVLDHWARAIRVRATLDWSSDGVGIDDSFIERLVHLRALSERIGSDAAEAWLGESPMPAAADWGRLICTGRSMSVAAGHRFAIGGIESELREAELILRTVLGRKPQADDLSRLVRDPLPGLDRLRVMPPASWARSIERHLFGRLHAAYIHASEGWGEPQAAAEIRELATTIGKDLPLLPVLLCGWKKDPRQAVAIADALNVLNEHPESLSLSMWRRVSEAVAKQRGEELLALDQSYHWQEKTMLTGCPASIDATLPLFGLLEDQAAFAACAELAPSNIFVARRQLRMRLSRNDMAGAQDIVDRFAKIDYRIAWMGCHNATPERRIALQTIMAGLDPAGWLELGATLAKAGRGEEAAAAFEKAFRSCRDRVAVSNQMGWWVDWLLDHQQTARAREVAEHGRTVYSQQGLETWARFCERTGDQEGAKKARLDIAERYR